jgi:hypothetical protein
MAEQQEHDPWVDPAFEQNVRDTAYFMWENDGRPTGREQEYWFTALEKCLRQREADRLLRTGPTSIDDLGRAVSDKTGSDSQK